MLAFFAFASAALVSVVSAANHTVIVGGSAGLVFTPPTIDAAVGDFVTYIFQTKNHTVTQSAFAEPCKYLTNATINAVGFQSGFQPVDAAATEFPAWTLEVLVDTPLWFYCQQSGHCQKGMTGAINPPKTGPKTFAAFQALAMYSGNATAASGAPANTGVSFSASQTGVGASAGATSLADAAQVAAASSGSTTSATTSGAAPSFSGHLSVGVAFVAALAAFVVLI